jgi:molybdenum cofactor guanylyltransferase
MKSCIILCGGKGRRISRDKGLIIIDDKPLVLHIINTVRYIVEEIILVLRDQEQAKTYKDILKDEKISFQLLTDVIKDQGPLGGILTGLLCIKSRYALILPCDSPFIQKSFISKMFNFVEEQGDFDAYVPRWDDGHLEPLHSIYKKNISNIIENSLDEGRRDVRSLIGLIKVKFIDVDKLDKTGKTFKNINKIEDILN